MDTEYLDPWGHVTFAEAVDYVRCLINWWRDADAKDIAAKTRLELFEARAKGKEYNERAVRQRLRWRAFDFIRNRPPPPPETDTTAARSKMFGPEQDVADALAELPPEAEKLLKFRYFEGKSLREIGDICGISPQRVYQLVAEALKLLHAKLRDRGDFTDAVYKLARNQRDVLYLLYFKKCTMEQTADQLKVAPAEVQAVEQIALEAMRPCFFDGSDLKKCLGCLNSEELNVIGLRYFARQPQKELAKTLGLGDNEVGAIIRAAIWKMFA